MQHFRLPKKQLTLIAAALAALPILSIQAGAAPPPARLDDELTQRLQSTGESELMPVIVEGAATSASPSTGQARADKTENRVRSGGGHVVGSSKLLGATVAELTPAQIRTLAADPTVGRIHFDTAVRATGTTGTDALPAGLTPIVFQQTVGAPDAWRSGNTGQGVTVAVLDTGIDNNDAAFGTRIKARVDLVDPVHPATGDPAGHGTHVAGIVAASRNSPSPGIAPDANLVSVRVLDEHGSSRLSTVILGLEWAVTHKSVLGIRVVVMALGGTAVAGYRQDPLAAAVELAWHSGLVVVVAAGNDGPGAGTIQTPGLDPVVLTVGASDDNGTVGPADDLMPTWSSVGPTADGLAKPDLLAPGRKIVSVRVPGSTGDVQNPTHIEGPTTIRFSGTSEAAGVAGGAAALLVEQRPSLSPDQIKALLVSTARPLTSASRMAEGAGLLNVGRALAARTPHVQPNRLPPADGLLRTILPLLQEQGFGASEGDNAQGDGQGDDVHANQLRWDQLRWDQLRWDQLRWDQLRWDQLRWDQTVSD